MSPIPDVLKVSPVASIQLRKNNKKIYQQFFHPDETDYTETVTQAFTLATNASQTLQKGTITTIRQALIESDRAVQIRFNAGTNGDPGPGLTAGGAMFLSACTVTNIKLINLNTTNTASVTYVVTD